MAKNTITITAAAKKLDVPEKKLREVLKPFYPDNWQTIKSIKLNEFEAIAEALKDLAENNQDSDEPHPVHDSPELQEVFDYNQQPYSDDVEHYKSASEQVMGTWEGFKNWDMENALGDNLYCNLSERKDSDLNPISEFNSNQDLEPGELAPQQAQALKVAVQRTFSDFAIDINNIVSALAYASAMKAFSDFKTIHSATFRHHANQYISDFDAEYQQMLTDLDSKCDPKAFLSQRGITTA